MNDRKTTDWNEGWRQGFNEGKNHVLFWGTNILLISFIIGCVGVGVLTDYHSEKFIEVNSKVVSVTVHYDIPMNYASVFFENGEHYNINFPNKGNTLDLDDGDHVLIRLRWSSGFLSQNTHDCWGIVNMVKY